MSVRALRTAAAAVLLAFPGVIPAQEAGDRSSGVSAVADRSGFASTGETGMFLQPGAGQPLAARPLSSGSTPDDPDRRSPWWTPLASAALPGAGQAVLGQDRFVAYMAVEAYFWLRFFADRREGLRQRDAYRGLANDVARAWFSGDKPDGDFEYYERMEHFIESGVYDVIPGGTLEPETDTTTFNGSLWLLARRTYWTDPELPPERESPAYLRAEALYRGRAVLPAYRWSWRDAQLEQDIYRRTISQSNEAFRQAVQDLGVVLANHVLSTVDAYVAVRLQRSTTARSSYDMTVKLPWEPGSPDRCRTTC